MHLTIFGATGGTGKELVQQALTMGHELTVYVRDPAKLGSLNDRVSVVQGELDQRESIDRAISGADVVFSALGPTSNKPGNPLTKGLRLIVSSMEQQGVKRLIAATGAGVADPHDKPQLIGRIFGLALRIFSKHVLEDSQGMVAVIRNSDLDWTLARAPRLNDKPGSGQIIVGYAGQGPGTQLSRADFAYFMLQQIEDDKWLKKAPMISN